MPGVDHLLFAGDHEAIAETVEGSSPAFGGTSNTTGTSQPSS
jgi:hypothetical protein